MSELQEKVPGWVAQLQDSNPFDGEVGRWALAIGVFVVIVFGLRLVRRLLLSRLQGLVDRTSNVIDDLVLDLVRRTGWWFFVALGLFVGIMFLQLPPYWVSIVKRLFALAVLVQIGAWADHVLRFWIDSHLERTRQEDPSRLAVLTLFSLLSRVAVWSIVLLLALDNMGVDITALIAGLGIGGIAIGLALQSVLKDAFASLSIIMDKPFEVGDFVIVEDLAGDVEHIGLKSTRIRSLSGEELVLSNDDLLSSRIRNFKQLQQRRVFLKLCLAYENANEQLADARPIVKQIIDDHPLTSYDRAYVKDFEPSSIDFEVAYYVTVPEFQVMMDVRQEINLEIHRRFEQEGIQFAYPGISRVVLEGNEPEGRPDSG